MKSGCLGEKKRDLVSIEVQSQSGPLFFFWEPTRLSRFNTLAQPRTEPEAGGALLSYFWSLLAGLLVPVLVVLVGLVAVLLNSGGLSNESNSIRLGTHLYVPLP